MSVTGWVERVARRLRRERRDAGVAMVMVLGIMMVGSIILTTLAVVTVYNATVTSETRLQARTIASADAGIDLILSQLEGKQYDQLGTVCSDSFVIDNDTVDVVTEYTVDRGGMITTVECPLATDTATTLRITATATTEPLAALDGEQLTETVAAIVNPTLPEVLLDKAIFSEGSVTLTNQSHLVGSGASPEGGSLNDAHVYSNGAITCETNEVIEGKIIAAHGNVQLTNTCEIYSDVWASGTVRIPASGPLIDGNVYAASAENEAFYLAGNARVSGTIVTNGGARIINNSWVGGSVITRTKGVTLDNTPRIEGSVYSQGSVGLSQGDVGEQVWSMSGGITGSDGSSIGGSVRAATSVTSPHPALDPLITPAIGVSTFPANTVPGSSFPDNLGYTSGAYNTWSVQPPQREPMPRVSMGAADIQKWLDQGYYPHTVTNCSGSNPTDQVNGLDGSYQWIVFFECTGPVPFNDATLVLKNNVALVSDSGFRMQNQNWFRSDDPASDTPRTLHVIVPADATGVTWAPEPGGSGQLRPNCPASREIDIFMDKIGVKNVKTMFYTPCGIQIQNGLIDGSDDMRGQIYAGKVSLPNKITLQMTPVPVPSLATSSPDPTSLAEMSLASRFDIQG